MNKFVGNFTKSQSSQNERFPDGGWERRSIFRYPGAENKKISVAPTFWRFFRLIIETEERIKTCQGESGCKRTGERQAS